MAGACKESTFSTLKFRGTSAHRIQLDSEEKGFDSVLDQLSQMRCLISPKKPISLSYLHCEVPRI